MERKTPDRARGRGVKDLVKFFSQREPNRCNASKPIKRSRQDSANTNTELDPSAAGPSKSALRTDRSSDAPPSGVAGAQRRVRFEDSLPTVSTGASFTENVRNAYKTAWPGESSRRSVLDNDEDEEELLDARLQAAKDRGLNAIHPAHRVAWAGSRVEQPPQPEPQSQSPPERQLEVQPQPRPPRTPVLPDNGCRNVLLNAEQRVAKGRTRKFEGRTRSIPFLANGSEHDAYQIRSVNDEMIPSSSVQLTVQQMPTQRDQNRCSDGAKSTSDQEDLDRPLLSLAHDRINTPQSPYMHAPIQEMIKLLEQKISADASRGSPSTRTPGTWDEYDQAHLDLSRMVDDDDDVNDDYVTTGGQQDRTQETGPGSKQHAIHNAIKSRVAQAPGLLSSSSSVYSRSINSTSTPINTSPDPSPTSSIEINPSNTSIEGKGQPAKPPPSSSSSPNTGTPKDPPSATSAHPKTATPSPPSPTTQPLPLDARASNISRELISITEFPQARDGMRDSGVDVWTQEEIAFVKRGIEFADGVGW